MPERLYLSYSPPPKPAPVEQAFEPAETPTEVEPSAAQPSGYQGGYRTYANRKFEIPVRPVESRNEQTLLQPNFFVEQKPVDLSRLPHMAFWSNPVLPKPTPKRFVMPGRQTEARQPALIAEPRLNIPNNEVRLSSLPMTAPQFPATKPALLVEQANTLPLQTFETVKPKPDIALSMDNVKGDPINVLALNPRPAPPVPEVAVPALSQVGVIPRAADTADTGPGIGESGRNVTVQSLQAADSATSQSANPRIPRTVTSVLPHPARHVPASNLGAGAAPPLEAPDSRHPAPQTHRISADPIRLLHPENGVFDVVLVQASPEKAMLPDDVEPLSGRPVYTVYLQVGVSQEWVLHYCVAQSAQYRVLGGGSVVQLGNPAPVNAPYPKVTILPQVMQPRTSRSLLRGFLTEQGTFRGLEAVGENQKEGADVIPYVRQWEFRPAVRDGVPVEVEVLIMVPGPRA